MFMQIKSPPECFSNVASIQFSTKGRHAFLENSFAQEASVAQQVTLAARRFVLPPADVPPAPGPGNNVVASIAVTIRSSARLHCNACKVAVLVHITVRILFEVCANLRDCEYSQANGITYL